MIRAVLIGVTLWAVGFAAFRALSVRDGRLGHRGDR